MRHNINTILITFKKNKDIVKLYVFQSFDTVAMKISSSDI